VWLLHPFPFLLQLVHQSSLHWRMAVMMATGRKLVVASDYIIIITIIIIVWNQLFMLCAVVEESVNCTPHFVWE
jgi:hypothetical protein